MVKKILLGTIIFFLGSLSAYLVYLQKSHPLISPVQYLETDNTNLQNQIATRTSFSLNNAPTQSLKANITSMDGSIYWQSRTGIIPTQITSPISLQQGEEIITDRNSSLQFNFASSSAITMKQNTDIEIIQTLPINLVFNHKKGTANYQKIGDYPISIRSLNLLLHLNSGEITVNTDETKKIVTLTLKSGSATIAYNNPSFISKVWDLKPKQSFVFNSTSRKGYFKASL